jgi:serine/threonine protein kinase
MTAPTTVAALLELVRKSGLVDEPRLTTLLQENRLPDAPARAADHLVQAGLVTRYHAQNLLAGRFRGFLLGTYKLLQPVGKGGMSAVFLAEHISLKRRVALKVFSPERTGDRAALERFYREGRAAAALDHPRIVRFHDITSCSAPSKQTEIVHFLVMEYVEGRNLEEVVQQRGPLPIEEAVGYAVQAAEGLQHAAAKGVVHRDIKPANLLLDGQGSIKILDYGLARFFQDAGDDLTSRLDGRAVLGTADYIAPEQALHGEVDIRADIYSLGVTLYALLNGKPPFSDGNTSQKLLAHQLRRAESLSKVRHDVPVKLAGVVARMMAKDPEERYQSPAEVIEALGPWSPYEATALPAPSPARSPEPSPTPPRRRLWPIAVCGLTLVAAAGGGWLLLARGHRGSEKETATTAEVASQPAPEVKKTGTPAWAKPPLFAATFDTATMFTTEVKGQNRVSRELGLPDGWTSLNWDEEALSEVGVQQVGGKRALTVRNLEGQASNMMFLQVPGLHAGHAYQVRFEYRNAGPQRLLVKGRAAGQPAQDLAWVPATADWKWSELSITAEADGDYTLEFHHRAPGREQPLALARVEVWEPERR